jgi:Argininosuccinate lyase
MREILNNFVVNKKKMIQLAEKGYTTATDLADYLVKEHKYPFRKAYLITSKIVNLAEQKNKKLEDLLINEVKGIDKNLNENVLKLLTLENSVKSKKSYGGTSFENIKKMIKKYKKYV